MLGVASSPLWVQPQDARFAGRAEAPDQNQTAGSACFFAGNTKFLTRKIWGVDNSGLYTYHGKFTIMRELILAHAGEVLGERRAVEALSAYDRD
jgi:hypothetical protein